MGTCLRDAVTSGQGIDALFIDKDTLDLLEVDAVNRFLAANPCDVLVNCAAFTAVDKAEEEREAAFSINSNVVGTLAQASRRFGFRIIHISTDYVFDGKGSEPYIETDTPNPQTQYGLSKLSGERLLQSINPEAIIIRTAWLYSNYGKNFFLTMLGKAKAGEMVRVVDDQRGTPTYAGDLATAIMQIIEGGKWIPGTYHFTNGGETTWYGFTREIYRNAGADERLVVPIPSNEFPTAARRPAYSVLDKTKIRCTFGIEVQDWKESLKRMMKDADCRSK